MSYRLTIRQEPTYLHATVTGTNNRANVVGYLQEIVQECIARNCFRVLIEENLDGPRLRTLDVFEIAVAGSSQARAKMKSIAYVDVNAKGDLMKFAETVATNRAVLVRVFSSVSDAERWLMDELRREQRTPPQ